MDVRIKPAPLKLEKSNSEVEDIATAPRVLACISSWPQRLQLPVWEWVGYVLAPAQTEVETRCRALSLSLLLGVIEPSPVGQHWH